MDRRSAQTFRPRILLVGTEALHLRLPLMQQLREAGFEVSAAGALPQPEFDDSPFDYHQYSISRSFSPLGFRKSVRSLRDVIRRDAPDLVHAVNTIPCLVAPHAVRGTGVPCVRTVTGLGSLFSADSLLYRAMQAVFRLQHRRIRNVCESTIFQNPEDRDYFVENGLSPADKVGLIFGSGIDVDGLALQRSSPKVLDELRTELNLHGKTVVTMVSRLMKVKGVDEFAETAAAVRRQRPDTAFLLIGPAVTNGPMAVSASILDGNADVQWLGLRHDIPDLLAVSDVFALPTYLREGIPRVLFEAGALKLPLITTDTPGCRETVLDGENGFLIEPQSANALTEAVLTLLESPERRREMGQRSYELMKQRFELTIVSAAYSDLYRKTLGLDETQDESIRIAA
jgi:glycosyltransferase involved in cell wall biosynthesis